MKIRALIIAAIFATAMNISATHPFHPINCTTDACCMQVPFGADTNCCKTVNDPCGVL